MKSAKRRSGFSVVVVLLIGNGTRTANPDHDCLYDFPGVRVIYLFWSFRWGVC